MKVGAYRARFTHSPARRGLRIYFRPPGATPPMVGLPVVHHRHALITAEIQNALVLDSVQEQGGYGEG